MNVMVGRPVATVGIYCLGVEKEMYARDFIQTAYTKHNIYKVSNASIRTCTLRL